MHRVCWKFLLPGILFCGASAGVPAAVAQPADDVPPAAAANEPTLEDSPLLVQPETQAEQFEAVVLMVKLARPKLAKLYLEKVLTPKPSDELLLELHDKHGPAVFVQLSNIQALRPLSTQLLELVTEAFRRRGADPARIDGLIADLKGTVQQREVAIIALRSAGPVVVPRILQQMTNLEEAGERDLLVFTLTKMGRQIVPALLGALEAPGDDIRAAIIETLGWLQAREAVPYLWYPAYGPGQSTGVRTAAHEALARILATSKRSVERVSAFGAVEELKQIALEHYRGRYRWEAAEDGTVGLWSWQPQQATVGQRRLSPQAASLYAGARFARQALALSPEDVEIQALYAGFSLAADRHRAGWENSLPTGPGTAHDLALTLGADVVSQMLAQALEYGRPDAAVAGLQVLSQTATRSRLTEGKTARSPIIAALSYPDRRVQFAAAATVLELDPAEPFRGSSRVVSILARALNDNGAPGALIVHPRSEKARGIGAFLGEMGFEPFVATTGQEAFRVAAARSDIELIVLEINTIRWSLSQTIDNLRADARTAGIPIIIFGPDQMRTNVAGLLRRHALMTYIVTPSTSESFQSQVEPFLETFTAPPLTAEQRGMRREAAAYWLAHIAAGRRTRIFSVAPAETALLDALNDPVLAENALLALSAVPTKTVQQQFAMLATGQNVETSFRESAALQLAFHIQRFGALLDEQEVLAIRTSWQTATDPALATALASVVGSLKPNGKRIGQRLGDFPPPPLSEPDEAGPPGP